MASFSKINKQITEQITDALLLPQALSATIETIINKALLLNTNKNTNKNALASLDQTTLTVNLVELSFPVSFTINAEDHKHPIIVGTMIESSVIENSAIERSVFKSSIIESNYCTISTSLKTLNKIKENQQITQLIKAGELDVEGDIKVAQQFANIAQQLEIDWQSELAKHLGDVPTHKLVEFGNKITKKIKTTSKQIERDVTEYLVHEIKLVVTNSELKGFNQAVCEIEQEVNLVSERIEKLFKHKHKYKPNT
jgi:ubiquinone biosynthesis accessory factor UbiJ